MKNIFTSLETVFNQPVSRKKFLKYCMTGLGALVVSGTARKLLFAKTKEESTGRVIKPVKCKHDLVVVKGDDPYKITVKAIESLGGMDKFVKKGAIVGIKPNIGWNRTPEQAANTNPQVVAALIDMCLKSGAKRVNVFDNTCDNANECYTNSGIAEIIDNRKNTKLFTLDDWNVVKAKFSYKSSMQGWDIYRDAIDCDVFINVPILKDHGLTKLTLSMKNLMGVCGGSRGLMHFNIGPKLVDITDFIKPDLTVIDAYRVLLRNGPSGGDIKDVELKKTVIAGTDPSLADTYAASFMNIDPMTIPNIKEAAKRGFGITDITKANILKVNM
jgi:uncharacterized protein (DUF362 family)